MTFYQQGDCLIKSCELPTGLKKVASKALVASQVSGHTHRVVGPAEVLKDGNVLYIRSKKPFQVQHEEHKALKVPAGTYRVDAVREYDHFAEEARAVAD